MLDEPIKKEEDIIIYGLDADLIMLSLVSNKKHIYLLREAVEFGKRVEESFLFLNIDYLKKSIFMDLKDKISEYDSTYLFKTDEESILINDYIFLCFIIGNDFLPHFSSYNLRNNGLDKILKEYISIYINYGKSLVDYNRKKINNSFLSSLIKKLSKFEDKL